MLLLSDVLGQPVGAGGHVLGPVRDVAVRLDGRLAGILTGGRHERTWIPAGAISAFEADGVEAAVSDPGAKPGDVLWLARDVQDTQIVDLHGRRVVRVGDVAFARHGPGIVVDGVLVGAGPVLRRLGLGRLARRRPGRRVPWTDLHPLSARGHALALANVDRLSPVALGQVAASEPPGAASALSAVPGRRAAEALAAMHPAGGARALDRLSDEQAGATVTVMQADDAAAVLRRLTPARRDAVLGTIDAHRARELARLLAFAPTTAGGMMTPSVISVPADATAEAARAKVLRVRPAAPGLLTAFAVDAAGRPVGAWTPSALLRGDERPQDVPVLRHDQPVDDVIDVFALNDVLAVPVVDDGGALIGAIAVDDVLEELLIDRLPRQRRRFPFARGGRRA